MKDEIDELAKLMANRIGSPWGEGATYSHEQAETSGKPKENGRLNSHLDDEDFELFVSDLKQAILALKKKWEIEQDKYSRADEFLWFTRKIREFMDTSTSPKYKVFESNFIKQYEQKYINQLNGDK